MKYKVLVCTEITEIRSRNVFSLYVPILLLWANPYRRQYSHQLGIHLGYELQQVVSTKVPLYASKSRTETPQTPIPLLLYQADVLPGRDQIQINNRCLHVSVVTPKRQVPCPRRMIQIESQAPYTVQRGTLGIYAVLQPLEQGQPQSLFFKLESLNSSHFPERHLAEQFIFGPRCLNFSQQTSLNAYHQTYTTSFQDTSAGHPRVSSAGPSPWSRSFQRLPVILSFSQNTVSRRRQPQQEKGSPYPSCLQASDCKSARAFRWHIDSGSHPGLEQGP